MALTNEEKLLIVSVDGLKSALLELKTSLINTKQSKIPVNTTAGTTGAIALNCDTVYELGTLTGNVTFSLNTAPDDGYLHEYMVSFSMGSTAYTVTMPTGVLFPSTVSIAANKHYEINIKGSYGLIATW